MIPHRSGSRRNQARRRLPAIGLLAAGLIFSALSANAAQAYEVLWRVVAGGGTSAARGGTYELAGTIGQPVAGASVGGGYTLDAGFWQARTVEAGGPIFTDDFEGD